MWLFRLFKLEILLSGFDIDMLHRSIEAHLEAFSVSALCNSSKNVLNLREPTCLWKGGLHMLLEDSVWLELAGA